MISNHSIPKYFGLGASAQRVGFLRLSAFVHADAGLRRDRKPQPRGRVIVWDVKLQAGFNPKFMGTYSEEAVRKSSGRKYSTISWAVSARRSRDADESTGGRP